MSGGHFNDNGYEYYKVSQFADELEEEIQNNFMNDAWGYHHGYPDEVIKCMKSYLPQMRKMAEIMRHIDFLYSGDHGSDSFIKRVKEVEAKYNDPVQQILNDPDDKLNERIAQAMQEAIAEYDT